MLTTNNNGMCCINYLKNFFCMHPINSQRGKVVTNEHLSLSYTQTNVGDSRNFVHFFQYII
jgi:hypothetical protein